MGLWRFIVAGEIHVVENCAAELEQLLRKVTPEWLPDQSNWKWLSGSTRVIPEGDVLPLRAKYGSNDWQIGLNHVYAAQPRGSVVGTRPRALVEPNRSELR